LRLPNAVVGDMLHEATEQNLLKVTGSRARTTLPVLSYSLTATGRAAVEEAWQRDRYLGPAPVSLKAFINRVNQQRLRLGSARPEQLRQAFADLVLTDPFIDQIGPAINAGRPILFYGPPGNGKSSIARLIGRVFSDVIHVPYCIEVEGQIIQMFDPNVHEPEPPAEARIGPDINIRSGDFDRRWIACRRPVVIAGGEFTLDMLDLRYLEDSNFYEAPLHMKALGGTFVIDDFGRQFVRPKDLLNRWMIPLEEKRDFLRLSTGATFSLPFDELVIFCTNLAPTELMDAAFLRRIPYKIRLDAPSESIFREIFRRAAADRGLEISEPQFEWLLAELRERRHAQLAGYQPKFIIEHIIEHCAFRQEPAKITERLLTIALDNLYTTGDS
jgi:energy-coupling factor transporter ATP-binding protein EcfA2